MDFKYTNVTQVDTRSALRRNRAIFLYRSQLEIIS